MPKRSLLFSPGVVVAGLALAACGSSGSKTPTSSGATTTAASATGPSTAPGQGPLVKTKTNPALGTTLADASGKTLYTLTVNGQPVPCTGPCTAVWPPLEAPTEVTTPTGGPGVTGLGLTPGPDGTRLVTANNMPLYRFSKDAAEGDAAGEGIASFGGVWHVVKVDGGVPTSTAGGAPTTGGSRRSPY